ncbi:choline/ethanolamine kinase domain-containing protein, putative [Eimeria acervulina]|uniref:ethanolamine kinase n=1 Tax=Eimeria acervulina TaxID=5801 RepID=U6GNW6_EIMAC|nr:choline/ethanolamine kinase domain-containing protein, putative [Eimeria acervulina]CDI81262.1 choline/ethanolamine kinase domain-containing protein, putative [Eimeria acervulina]
MTVTDQLQRQQQQQQRQQQQQQQLGGIVEVTAAAATATAAGTIARCCSNVSDSTVEPEQPDTDQQQQQQQQLQQMLLQQQQQDLEQQKDAIISAALLKAAQLIPEYLGIPADFAAAAAASDCSSSSSCSSNREQQIHQLLQGSVLTGGTTNSIVKVSRRDKESPCCLVRFYGRNTSLWIDRQREFAVLRLLSGEGGGKKILASFQGGVIESFVPGSPLLPEGLGFAADKIAKALALLHALPLHSQSSSARLISEFNADGSAVSALWPKLQNFLDMCFAEKARLGSAFHLDDCDKLPAVFDLLRKELEGGSRVVLCHGDLLAGNIIHQEDGSICFIDFEYAAAMERAFDIAGHFIEYGGFECEWHRIPTPAQQRAFLRVYLQQLRQQQQQQQQQEAAAADIEEEVQQLLDEIQPFFAVSHLYWGKP